MNAFSRNARVAAYQSASVHGGVAAADPHGLILMLMNAAIERLTMARACLDRGEIVTKTKLLHSCVNLIAELRGVLNLNEGGSLAQNLSDLYDYMMRRVLRGNAENDPQCLTEVLSLLGEIRSAWVAIAPEVQQGAKRVAPAA
ncbi:MAG TPA: flagellar export chaperone FliS [Steroidobacteraceae bacterium]|nr:flagellar export chaperone FliS [Steroidobacteraceae bacterium]